MNFCAISFTRTQYLHFHKNSGKIVAAASPSNLCSKNYSKIILQNYHISCKIFKISCNRIRERTTARIWGKTE